MLQPQAMARRAVQSLNFFMASWHRQLGLLSAGSLIIWIRYAGVVGSVVPTGQHDQRVRVGGPV